MKKKILSFIAFFLLSCFSYSQDSTYRLKGVDPVEILKNQSNFLKYYNEYLKLLEDFIALDSSSKVITKGDFFKQLSSGVYLPLRLTSNDSVWYKLYKINIIVDDYIPTLIRSIGDLEYKHYEMEDKVLPKFNYVDLEGRIYNHETTMGKIVVIKFWFIRCQKCVEEMPALNKLVKLYKNRKDIVFLSLAFDKKNDLRNFLTQISFKYAVVADQEDYLMKDLNIAYYPTHVVINKSGMVVKVVNSYEYMERILSKEALK